MPRAGARGRGEQSSQEKDNERATRERGKGTEALDQGPMRAATQEK